MRARLAIAASLAALAIPAHAHDAAPDGLLFRASADRDLTAEVAGGDAVPNFRSGVTVAPDGAIGGAARWADDGYVAWRAPGNIQAQRGTLAFFWRPRTAVGIAPFNIFRVGFADHSSWDMAFLRIDWNGHGFDGFVTDANLSRVRVSWRMPATPAPDAWHHIAFGWDETTGVRLFVDGQEVARKDQRADLDAGLDQFGMAGRVLSPHQVQSRYNFMRGSDLDEIRVYDRLLDGAAVAALAAKQESAPTPVVAAPVIAAARRAAWLHRYGWDTGAPPLLDTAVTRVRKVEFADAKDLKAWMWKGVDGIAETTWPGVYNRSALPGRHDYFELPDWNTYVEGGRAYDLTLPATERFNQIEIRGAAYGTLDWNGERLGERPQGVVRSVMRLPTHTGGALRFVNRMAEQPIQELWAYDITPGAEPAGTMKLDYTIRADAAPTLAALAPLNAFIAGRFAPDERTTVLAMPTSGVKAAVGAGAAGGSGNVVRMAGAQPIVHILVPASFGDAAADQPVARAWDYGWQNIHDGLDGIAIDLPAMTLAADARGLVPLNIRVKDPVWPGRDLIDLSVSVRPNEARTLWLDLRDRILPHDSLYLTIASAAPDFGARSLDGARLRLIFKPRAEATREHVADRFNQVKDNWGFLVEEHTASKRAGLYARLFADATDLLRVDPDHVEGRAYWADINYRPENLPTVALAPVPAGVPGWAHRQLQDLVEVRRFVEWWIDHRQVPYGDFGGGLSDDSDLVQQWPGAALMGLIPDRITASLNAVSDAVYRNGMITDGLGTITTDELHAYEEGLNSNAARLYLNWGEPRAVERLMANTRALGRVILPNPAGHLHFASSWYGARTIYRDDAWAWQKPYAFTVLHGPTLLGLYNGNPAARGLVTGTVDGWLAHGKQGPDGLWSFPNEINWGSDKERAGDGGGATLPLQAAWAAWHWTGDTRYLRPLEGRVAKVGPGALTEINDDVFGLLPAGPGWRAALAAGKGDDPFARYARWHATGDTAPLAALHDSAARDKAARRYMQTEGHWWSDRVEAPSEWLQRERLGGIALRRNQSWPANAVSWRFAEPGAAERVALLVRATPNRIRITGFNTAATAQRAELSTWNIAAGEWRITTAGGATAVSLERGATTTVTFAPGESAIDLELVRASDPVDRRPDLGIGVDDVAVKGRRVTLTIHSLGAQATTGGTAALMADGRVLATAAIAPLAAPVDLLPRTTRVTLTLPAGIDPRIVAATVALPGDAPEVTRRNNRVALVR
ncbi:LamG-like jellyroll fold domain-containing protein [Sphingomonas sp. CFBP 8760]|uniref:LamG-like jellyroll fold domain-containing protein n=1 Tax=Sphingomonas sp. CFBP 8760 TaxID=2775282 RepID=UPI00177DB032|nr:LamG-like jellyroll fold domain-containing protein [Sphingomonas sp. CFBP 8760]MBD8546423.1 LamG domain-containing protein [Sphingomonas sp. CFBP 8760]